MIVVLLSILVILLNGQISPTWLESAYAETKTVLIVDNHQKTTGAFYQNSTYTKPLTSPHVCLSIVQLKIVSDTGQIGFRNTVSTFYSDRFTHLLQIFSPTEIWHLQLRYFAYDNDIDLLQGLNIGFFNESGGNLNTGSGVRTQTFTSTLAESVTTTNSFVYATFLTGYEGTATDYYQANMTAAVSSTTQVQVTVTVASDTIISRIVMYVLMADLTNLQVQSKTFVETAVLQQTYGAQYTYFTPTAFFDDNYISGLRSFSMRDNIQFNFTIDNITFDSSETSYYDDVSCYNLYTRICDSPYTYYNKVDRLCYTQCPSTTYPVQAYILCEACDYTCATCTQANTCDTCPTNRQLNSSTLCRCVDYYYEYNQQCRACHHSCQTCYHSGQYFNCLTCDSNMKRTHNSTDDTCNCDSGYQDVQISRCEQICGDGLVYEDACDDGNTVNGDGCSSTCTLQNYFTCTGAPSDCKFDANLTITIEKIQKAQYANTAFFYILVSPFIDLMSQLTTQSVDSNVTLTNKAVYVEDNYIVYQGTYSADLQSTYARIDFNASSSGPFSQLTPANTTFVVSSTNGLPIRTYSTDNYLTASAISQGSYIVGWIAFAFAFIFCWYEWKQLGTQLYFTIQFSFMSYVVMSSFTPNMVALGQVKYLMGYNDIAGVQTTYLNRRVMEYMGYSIGFQYNFNLMVIIQGFALIMYGFYRLAVKIYQKKIQQDPTLPPFEEVWYGKILGLFAFDFFVYWAFFNMNQIVVATTIQGEDITSNPGIFAYAALCILFIVIAMIAVFARPKSMKSYRKVLFHNTYGDRTFLFVLIGMILMNALLLMSVLIQTWIYYMTLAVPAVIIGYLIIRKPFRSHLNNVRLVLILLSLLAVQILVIVTLNISESETLYFPIGVLVCIIFSILVTLIVWIILLILKCRKKFSDKVDETQYSSKNQDMYMKKKLKEADYSYHYGKSSIRNPIYEMSEIQPSVIKSQISTGRSKSKMQNNDNNNFGNYGNQYEKSKTRRKQKLEESQREDDNIFLSEDKPSSKKQRRQTDSGLQANVFKKSILKESQTPRQSKPNVSFKQENDDTKTVSNKKVRNMYEDILKSKVSHFK